MKMNIILLVILSCISLFAFWLIISLWYGNRLRKNTARRKAEVERLEKEIYDKKEKRKHLGYHAMEREEFTPSFSEEESEAKGYPNSATQDEEDIEEEELTEGQIQDEDEELEVEEDV